jgi:hypothetical protein
MHSFIADLYGIILQRENTIKKNQINPTNNRGFDLIRNLLKYLFEAI